MPKLRCEFFTPRSQGGAKGSNVGRRNATASHETIVRGHPATRLTLVIERTKRLFWRLSVVIMLIIAVADSLLGSRVILIGLLIIGPCCALLGGRRASAGQAGAIAVGLSLVLALPDGIWGTTAQFAFTGAVLMVSISCAWAAGIIESATKY